MKPSPESVKDLPSLRAYLASIPANRWTVETGDYAVTKGCALSWLTPGRYQSGDHPAHALIDTLFAPLVLPRRHSLYPGQWAMADINDGKDGRYTQGTPKKRMLAAIDDLIAGTIPASS